LEQNNLFGFIETEEKKKKNEEKPSQGTLSPLASTDKCDALWV